MGYGCLQTTFCAFNGLIAVLAAACVGVGAWALAAEDEFLKQVGEVFKELKIDGLTAADITNAAILIVAIGSIILLLAAIGCCGAHWNNKCLLGVFFIAMVIITIGVIVVAVLVHVYPNKLRSGMEKVFKDFINNKTGKDAVDEIQTNLKCCGINGPQDYKGDVPESCAGHKEGCVDKVMAGLKNVQNPVFIVAIITLILLVLATGISGYLYCKGGEAV